MPTLLKPRPTADEMFAAMVSRDTSFDGVFVAAIRTTGIFCRPGCGAKKPRRENVEFFASPREAMHAGYRACKRCRPLDLGRSRPEWVERIVEALERSADRRVSADDLRTMGIEPARAARWFKANYGMTFQAFCRARRMGEAMKRIREGASIGRAAASTGYESESGFREAFEEVFGAPPGRARARAADAQGTYAAARELVACWIESPLGPMLAAAGDHGVCLLEFVDRRALATQVATLRRRFGAVIRPGSNAHLATLQRELAAYFAGRSAEFSVKLEAPGTEFQALVWEALRAIPSGQTRSYLDIARQIGRATATRAVARANGDNRLAILIPCHRVIGSDGTLTGYGGGVWRKEWLLEHERTMAGRPSERLFGHAG
ncbi:MAG: methylated-DNA--[protein]-cysteine S-methyltransferase [Phycisphaeraceae bacterium]|nr:methylated-DNA--[protein]-cysteine S-methyltransferase [Phycisphaeraceae bacterium]